MDSLNYLKNLDNVMLPSSFTYLNLDLYYQNKSIKERDKTDAITDIPTKKITFDKLTSFTERKSRINSFIRDDKSLDIDIPENAKPLIIRVLIPRVSLSDSERKKLSIDKEYQKNLDDIYSGYGDRNHPKLCNTSAYIFASTYQDEVTKKDIDILYAVRAEDVDRLVIACEDSLKTLKYEDLGTNMHLNRFLSYNTNHSNLYKASPFISEYYENLNSKESGYTITR